MSYKLSEYIKLLLFEDINAVSKINRLLRIAQNTTNAGEREAALKNAKAISVKYGFDINQLIKNLNPDSSSDVISTSPSKNDITNDKPEQDIKSIKIKDYFSSLDHPYWQDMFENFLNIRNESGSEKNNREIAVEVYKEYLAVIRDRIYTGKYQIVILHNEETIKIPIDIYGKFDISDQDSIDTLNYESGSDISTSDIKENIFKELSVIMEVERKESKSTVSFESETTKLKYFNSKEKAYLYILNNNPDNFYYIDPDKDIYID